ncbi:MAG TPA: hypothetical protein VN874_04665 [Myxococcales bacterium]|jgi:hypothetical protein|nr:hypothetical protein [Myxococcales bacterium]
MADILHPAESDPADEPAIEQPIDPGDFEVAATAADSLEAEILVRACAEEHIPAILQSPRSGLVGTISSPVEAYVIQVPARDLDRARLLLAERRAALQSDPDGAARAAEEEEAASEQGTDGPRLADLLEQPR